jgi:hypothetical protein
VEKIIIIIIIINNKLETELEKVPNVAAAAAAAAAVAIFFSWLLDSLGDVLLLFCPLDTPWLSATQNCGRIAWLINCTKWKSKFQQKGCKGRQKTLVTFFVT